MRRTPRPDEETTDPALEGLDAAQIAVVNRVRLISYATAGLLVAGFLVLLMLALVRTLTAPPRDAVVLPPGARVTGAVAGPAGVTLTLEVPGASVEVVQGSERRRLP